MRLAKWNAMPSVPVPNAKRAFVVDPNAVYHCDGGMILCGSHLGTSARMTGRDISGQKVAIVTERDHLAWAKEFGHRARCERCEERLAIAFRKAFQALTGAA